jgi:biotin operon repressor
MNDNQTLLLFFKALADANRLKIIGLLAHQPHTVEQIAAILGLGASTVSHHLSRLSEAGLVTARAQSYYNFYQLEDEQVKRIARQMLSGEAFPPIAVTEETSALDPDQKIVRHFLLPDGQLKTIPAQRKKLLAVLRFLAKSFEPGVQYTEKQVNEILARYHEDTASLRRELIGAGLMARESGGSRYWLTETRNAA